MTFVPFPYSVTGPSGSGMPMPSAPAPMQSPPQDVRVTVAQSREIDLATISGYVDPPVAATTYTRDFLMLVPSEGVIQRLRLSAGRNGTGVILGFRLIQLREDGTESILIPHTAVRQLDLAPTDFDSVAEMAPDVPVLLRVVARYQEVVLFATLDVLYTSAPAQ